MNGIVDFIINFIVIISIFVAIFFEGYYLFKNWIDWNTVTKFFASFLVIIPVLSTFGYILYR